MFEFIDKTFLEKKNWLIKHQKLKRKSSLKGTQMNLDKLQMYYLGREYNIVTSTIRASYLLDLNI